MKRAREIEQSAFVVVTALFLSLPLSLSLSLFAQQFVEKVVSISVRVYE
jgi:hypothetical protein